MRKKGDITRGKNEKEKKMRMRIKLKQNGHQNQGQRPHLTYIAPPLNALPSAHTHKRSHCSGENWQSSSQDINHHLAIFNGHVAQPSTLCALCPPLALCTLAPHSSLRSWPAHLIPCLFVSLCTLGSLLFSLPYLHVSLAPRTCYLSILSCTTNHIF